MILPVIAAITILACGLYVYRTRGLGQKLADSERQADAAKVEHEFLKNVIVQHVARPQIVVMSEEQFIHLVETIQSTVEAVVRPNSIN